MSKRKQPIQRLNPLVLHDHPLTSYDKKKLLLTTQAHSVKIPTNVRKLLKTCTKHTDTFDDATNELINPLIQQILDTRAVTFMADALLYYNEHHNFSYLSKETSLITRSSSAHTRKTKPVPYATMRAIYDKYTCGIEERHHYYASYMSRSTKKHRKITIPTKSRNHITAYNLFIKTQWSERKEELQKIKTECNNDIIEVMKILSREWSTNEPYHDTGDPDKDGVNVKTYYAKKAREHNEALPTPTPAVSVSNESTTPELAV